MAILTPNQLTELRRGVSQDVPVVDYTKAVCNAACQAIEDWFDLNRVALNMAINTATAPVVLTPAQKFACAKYWLRQKFDRGG